MERIDKPFARWTKEKKEKMQITKVRNESGYITVNFREIKSSIPLDKYADRELLDHVVWLYLPLGSLQNYLQ